MSVPDPSFLINSLIDHNESPSLEQIIPVILFLEVVSIGACNR